MATFEEIFGIPAGHTLKEVDSRGGNYDDWWTHEEYNPKGELVASYKSWDSARPKEQHSSGWRKFAPDGSPLGEHDDLPL